MEMEKSRTRPRIGRRKRPGLIRSARGKGEENGRDESESRERKRERAQLLLRRKERSCGAGVAGGHVIYTTSNRSLIQGIIVFDRKCLVLSLIWVYY